MTRVILANDVAQVDGLTGRRYGGNTPGRVFDMHPADARAVVRLGGALAGIGTHASARAVGYRCPACGFGSYLRRCSRCGAECERE